MCVRVLTLLIRQVGSKKSPRVRGGFFSVLVGWGIVGWIYGVSGMGDLLFSFITCFILRFFWRNLFFSK